MSTVGTDNNFASIRAELEEKLRELTRRATDVDEELSEAPDPDWDENAISSESDEVLEKLGQAAAEEIAQIRLAISRIDAGTYGSCSQCGTTIPAERLEALPFATRCVNCGLSSTRNSGGWNDK